MEKVRERRGEGGACEDEREGGRGAEDTREQEGEGEGGGGGAKEEGGG